MHGMLGFQPFLIRRRLQRVLQGFDLRSIKEPVLYEEAVLLKTPDLLAAESLLGSYSVPLSG